MEPSNTEHTVNASIVVPFLSRYRMRLIEQLDRHRNLSITWCADTEDRLGSNIPTVDARTATRFVALSTRRLPGGIIWQTGILTHIARSTDSVFVFTGDLHYLSTWICAILLRLRRLRVIFWTHGWRRPDHGIKRWVRLAFYRLANELALYADRAKQLGAQAGYPPSRMDVVYNSGPFPIGWNISLARERAGDLRRAQHWAIISRLTPSKRYDEAFKQIGRLRDTGRVVRLTVIGDGPERQHLEDIAQTLQLDVHFLGEMYDPTATSQLLQRADICVSPGNVGLNAIQALSSGCPVATHDDPNEQGPEQEAIIDGETGVLFQRGDFRQMAELTWRFVERHDRAVVAQRCLDEVTKLWTSEEQARRLAGVIARTGEK